MTLFAQQEGKGSQRHVIGGLLGRFFEKNRQRQGGGSKEGTGSGPQPNSFRGLQDNGSWVLTSDRLPFLPCPVLFLGWQEELEPYCHSGEKKQKTGARSQNLPSAVWMKQFLYLAKGEL